MNRTFICSRRPGPENSQIPPTEPHVSLNQPTTLTLASQRTGSRMKAPLFSTALVLTTLFTGRALAETAPAKFVPFSEFVQSVRTADANELLARPSARANVQEPAAIEEMRQHLLKTYQGVSVSHSYVLGSQTFDCVPMNQQPAVRAFGLKSIASAPPSSASKAPGNAGASSNAPKLSQLPKDKTTDEFGNALGCEDRTIPLARTTLEQLSHFKNLHEFFQKGPNGAGRPPEAGKFVPPDVDAHKYAYSYQWVDNHGDNAAINLWRPYVYTDIGEVFTLAQSWTLGVSSAPIQSAEVGFQNYPARTGTENPVLFIYFTSNGYGNTGNPLVDGCYDLTCGAFVQVNKAWAIGGSFTADSYSVSDGHQNELQLQYYLWQGNWWLSVNGTWVGYYPGWLYAGGQLSNFSNLIEYGSESVGSNVWPAEGSGLWANSGYTYAAYQRLLWYRDTSNNTFWDTLTMVTPSPSCYSITPPSFDVNSGIYFYFGGPGGASCE